MRKPLDLATKPKWWIWSSNIFSSLYHYAKVHMSNSFTWAYIYCTCAGIGINNYTHVRAMHPEELAYSNLIISQYVIIGIFVLFFSILHLQRLLYEDLCLLRNRTESGSCPTISLVDYAITDLRDLCFTTTSNIENKFGVAEDIAEVTSMADFQTQMLSILAQSAASERIFSVMNCVVTKSCCSLKFNQLCGTSSKECASD